MHGWMDGWMDRWTDEQTDIGTEHGPFYYIPLYYLVSYHIISYHFILLTLAQLSLAERLVACTNSTHSLAPFSYRVPRPLFSAFPISPFPYSSHILKGSNPTHPSALVDELLIRTS